MRATTLVRTGAAVALTAVIGGLATDPGSAWYRTLRTPAWQPPPPAYPLVWTPLYADIAVASAAVLDAAHESGDEDAGRGFAVALGANLVLNAGWNALFFAARRPWPAAVECAALTLSSADLVRRAAALDRRAAIALAPYPAWCAFATALTVAIARRNSGTTARANLVHRLRGLWPGRSG
ncbi:tryptophan-rich sensory protein [Nakamurella sp. YIM 132087]|uniref:Tryptophan-rich sensory protein n=1 Tax=Nakamurella alba TaxID=2665158 RepID=A0A7K1FUR2_9ACTN|nr:TspO/MBR family protein [Nakamurella alba]MTD16943.1 tryptophan-rich sensory protein [Nakamurella alba]